MISFPKSKRPIPYILAWLQSPFNAFNEGIKRWWWSKPADILCLTFNLLSLLYLECDVRAYYNAFLLLKSLFHRLVFSWIFELFKDLYLNIGTDNFRLLLYQGASVNTKLIKFLHFRCQTKCNSKYHKILYFSKALITFHWSQML